MTERSYGRPPGTAGELRRRLAELGNPWSVDQRLGDEDPLPEYPRGGQPTEELPEDVTALVPEDDLAEILRHDPPSNPFLRARWVELGLLSPEDAGGAPGTAPPPPDRSEPHNDRQEEDR